MDAIMEQHTEDTQFWTHAGGEPAKGKDAVRAEFAQVFERFPEFAVETYRVLYGEDFWVLDWALINGDVALRLRRHGQRLARRAGRAQGHLHRHGAAPVHHARGREPRPPRRSPRRRRERQRDQGVGLNDLPLVTELPVEHLVDFSVDLEAGRS